jgi:hypothetical protein
MASTSVSGRRPAPRSLLAHDPARRVGTALELIPTATPDGVRALAARIALDGPAAGLARACRGASIRTRGLEARPIGPGGLREIRRAIVQELSVCTHPADPWARLDARG